MKRPVKRCPCGGEYRVMDTQEIIDGSLIWRRRMCPRCRQVIYTIEGVYDKTPSQIEEEISRGKIFKKAP